MNVTKQLTNYLSKSQIFHKKKTMYKDRFSFEKRKEESEGILAKYPERIPIICEGYGIDTPQIDRNKYLVPDDLTMAQFLYVIRKRIKIGPEKSIYLFVQNHIIPGNKLLATVYEKHCEEDGFLYITYSGENTFG